MIKNANTFLHNSSVLMHSSISKNYIIFHFSQFKVTEDVPAIFAQELKVLLHIILLTLVLITLERLLTLLRNKQQTIFFILCRKPGPINFEFKAVVLQVYFVQFHFMLNGNILNNLSHLQHCKNNFVSNISQWSIVKLSYLIQNFY